MRVHSSLWAAVACVLGLLLATSTWFRKLDGSIGYLVLMLVFSVVLLSFFQHDYNFGFYLLAGACFAPMVLSMLVYTSGCQPHARPLTHNSYVRVREGAQREGAQLVRESTADNVYRDLSMSLDSVLIVAAAQLMLIFFYVYALFTNGRPDFAKTDVYVFYFVGVLFQSILFERHIGGGSSLNGAGDFMGREIYSMARAAHSNGTVLRDKKHNIVHVPWWYIELREALDMIINFAGGMVILLSLPLQLAGTSSTYFEFLLNSCATVFILELDDKEGVTFELVKDFELGAGLVKEDTCAEDEADDQEPHHWTFPSRDYPDMCMEEVTDDTPRTSPDFALRTAPSNKFTNASFVHLV